MIVRATRPLVRGEELTISYGPLVGIDAYEERQRILLRKFGFVCLCEACRSVASSGNAVGYDRLHWLSCSRCRRPPHGCVQRPLFPRSPADLSVKRLVELQHRWWAARDVAGNAGAKASAVPDQTLTGGCPFCKRPDCRELDDHTVRAGGGGCIRCSGVDGGDTDEEQRKQRLKMEAISKNHRQRLEVRGLAGNPSFVSRDVAFACRWWVLGVRSGSLSMERVNALIENAQALRDVFPDSAVTLYRHVLALEMLMLASPNGLAQYEHLFFIAETLLLAVGTSIVQGCNPTTADLLDDFAELSRFLLTVVTKTVDPNHALSLLALSLYNRYAYLLRQRSERK